MVAEARTIVERIADARPEAEVVRADPEAAGKRHKVKRGGRDVAMWPAIDGVADLSVRGLSADQAAEAFGYVDAIARAVKSTGDSRTLAQLRAEVAYTLLSGNADIIDCPPRRPPATIPTSPSPPSVGLRRPTARRRSTVKPSSSRRSRRRASSGAVRFTGSRFPDHDLHYDVRVRVCRLLSGTCRPVRGVR